MLRTILAWLILIAAAIGQLLVVTIVLGPSLAGIEGVVSTLQQLADDPFTAMPEVKTQAVALLVAVAASLFGGGLVAVAQWRRSPIWLGAMMAPLLLPMALFLGPEIGSPLLTLAAHGALGVAIGTLCGAISLGRLPSGAMLAAMCCGVSPLGALFRVMLPALAPGLLAGSVLTAIASGTVMLLRARPAGPLDPALLLTLPPDLLLPMVGAAAGIALLAGFATWLIRRLD